MDNYEGILNQLMGQQQGILSNPQDAALMQLGLGLLSQSGPSPRKVGTGEAFGKAGLSALDTYQQQQVNQRRDQLANMQMMMQRYKMQKELEAKAAFQEWIKRNSGGGQSNMPAAEMALAQGATQGDIGPTVGNEQRMAGIMSQGGAQRGQSVPPNFDELLGLGIPAQSVNAMRANWELRNPAATVHGGYAIPPMRGLSGPTALPQRTITPSGQGVQDIPGQGVSPIPGSLQTYGAFRNIDEQSKAAYDPFMGVLDPQGRPIPMTRGEFAEQRRGQSQLTPSTEAPAPTERTGVGLTPFGKSTLETQGKKVAEYIDKTRTEADQAASILTELDFVGNMLKGFDPSKLAPAKKAIGEWAIGLGVMTKAEADSAFGSISDMQGLTGAINNIVARAVRQTDAQPAVRQIELMRQAYPQLDQTGEGAQMLLDLLRKQQTLSVEKARYMAQYVAKPGGAESIDDFNSQWRDVVKRFDYIPADVMQKYPNRGGSGQVMENMPPASKHRGRVIEDSAGKRYKSDGMTWKEM